MTAPLPARTVAEWAAANEAAEAARIALGLGTCQTCPGYCQPETGWPNTPSVGTDDYYAHWTPPAPVEVTQ